MYLLVKPAFLQFLGFQRLKTSAVAALFGGKELALRRILAENNRAVCLCSLKPLQLNPGLHCLLTSFVHQQFPLQMLSSNPPYAFTQPCVELLDTASINAIIQHE